MSIIFISTLSNNNGRFTTSPDTLNKVKICQIKLLANLHDTELFLKIDVPRK